jgi:hypothetical protein
MYFPITNTEIFIAALLIVVLFLAFVPPARRKIRHVVIRKGLRSHNDLAAYDDGYVHETPASMAGHDSRSDELRIGKFGAARRERFVAEWQTVQSGFVDHPAAAVIEAGDLIASLLEARGYPRDRFEHRAADFSATYPHVLEDYRVAHAIAERQGRGEASTEELRTAMIKYRDIFDELIRKQWSQEKMPAA